MDGFAAAPVSSCSALRSVAPDLLPFTVTLDVSVCQMVSFGTYQQGPLDDSLACRKRMGGHSDLVCGVALRLLGGVA